MTTLPDWAVWLLVLFAAIGAVSCEYWAVRFVVWLRHNSQRAEFERRRAELGVLRELRRDEAP